MHKLWRLVCATTSDTAASLGLLVARVFPGLLLAVMHGWGKLKGFSEMASSFPDPLGVGSTASLTLAVLAEFFCGLLLILGFATRAVALPLVINMAVAAFIVHGPDPWSKKEFALLYLIPFAAVLLGGAGKFSIDGMVLRPSRA